MRIKKLRRKILRQVAIAGDRMTDDEKSRARAICEDPEKLAELNERIEAEVNPWRSPRAIVGMKSGDVFSNLVDWFKEHWWEILKLILSLIPVFLMEQHDEDS